MTFCAKYITAKTLNGTNVKVNDVDIIIEDGKPIIMFFVTCDNGQHEVFSEHALTDYEEVY